MYVCMCPLSAIYVNVSVCWFLDTVSCVCWDPASLYLVSAGGNDRHVRAWHNYPGRRVLLGEMKAELPKASSDALKVYII